MHEKFRLYPLLTEGKSLVDKNLLIQTLQSIHLIHWVMDAHKSKGSSSSKMADDHKLVIRFLLHCIGTAQQALSKEFTKSQPELEKLSFTKKQGHGTTCWWTHNRITFAHRSTVSEHIVDMFEAEQDEINLVFKLEQVIYKLLPSAYKVNHFKGFPYTPVVFPATPDDGVSNFNNIHNAIIVATSLRQNANDTTSLSHQICLMACIELASKNLILLNNAGHIPDIDIELVTDARNNIAHSACVGAMLMEMDSIKTALDWLSAHKAYFEARVIKLQPQVQEVEVMSSSSVSSAAIPNTVSISNVVNITPLYSGKRRNTRKSESNKITAEAVALLRSLVPWQPINDKDDDILSFTEHHVMSALLMEVENLYKVPLENRDYSRFDQIVMAFGPLVNQAHEFELHLRANTTPSLLQVCGKRLVMTVLPSIFNADTASGDTRDIWSFNNLVYCTGDFELIKRIAALGFTPTTDLRKKIAVLSFIRKTDTTESAEHKLKEFTALYQYYWGNFSVLELSTSIIINLHPDVSLKYLGRQFRQSVDKLHIQGEQQMTTLQISLQRYTATLFYPFCMLQLIPALLQQGKKADLERLILGPDNNRNMGLFDTMSSVYIKISGKSLVDSMQKSDVEMMHTKTKKICGNYIFFAAMHTVLLEQDRYQCTIEFFTDPKKYLATMFEQAKNGDYSKAIPFLREKIVPLQHIKQIFLSKVQQSSGKHYLVLIEENLSPEKWCLNVADFAWHYHLCKSEQIKELKGSVRKHIIITECEQAIAQGEGKYKLYSLVINNQKHELNEYLRGITNTNDFPTELPIAEANSSIVGSTNIFSLAKEFADDSVHALLKAKWEGLLRAKYQGAQLS